MTLSDIIGAGRQAQLDTEAALLRELLLACDRSVKIASERLGCAPSSLQRVLDRHPDLRGIIRRRGPRPRLTHPSKSTQ